MTTVVTLELDTKQIRFGSPLDEAAFFGWLDKLPCVSKVEGKGETLFIHMYREEVDEASLRELMALFDRYGVAMKPLRIFDKPEFSEWLHNERSFWYKSFFG